MPVSVSYPGVYIEEIPSGVRTITGVATSVCAFAGWAQKGPVDRAELVLSWPDFERKFGGLDRRSLMSYSVYHFFNNGGQRAYIVRVVTEDAVNPADDAVAAAVTLGAIMEVQAANPGAWGNNYAIVITHRSDDNSRFRLEVRDVSQNPRGVAVEAFENLSVLSSDSRYVTKVLEAGSALVTARVLDDTSGPPAETVIPASGEIPASAILAGGEDGVVLEPNDADFELAVLPTGGSGGVYTLDRVDIFNLLCVPGETNRPMLQSLQGFCRERRAFLIADCEQSAAVTLVEDGGLDNLTGADAVNSAFYFPWVKAPDPLQENRPEEFPPCGFIAGLYARTDTNRGVWKAPAGTEASLSGVIGVAVPLTNDENGILNPQAVNCIRKLPVYGTVSWGARTLQGNDERGSEWKYIPVRRTALFIEESLFRGTQWVVFEPNDEPLWAQIRLNVGAFMNTLFRQGAFQGSSPREAYFVKCDKDTTTQSDIDRGVVNILVGFAPLKPAEFVIIKIQQIVGQIPT
jgi:phage tail sheath protein FI